MEPLPRSAHFLRAKTLWEIALHLGGTPRAFDEDNRFIQVSVGNGSGERYRPWVTLGSGYVPIVRSVVNGELDAAFINPSAVLTQAYRGVGAFTEALPVRVLACYPSWDRFVFALHERTGLRSLGEIKERRYPLRVSVRAHATDSTRVLVDQAFACYGFSLADVERWGGSIQGVLPPGDPRRLAAIRAGEIDAVFDEGIHRWLGLALAHGFRTLPPEEPVLQQLETLGWRRAALPAGTVDGLEHDELAVDFSGWPLYCRASLDEDVAYEICEGLRARAEWIPWEEGAFTGIDQLWRETEATPLDVPLHPGAARWYQEHLAASRGPHP